MSSASGFPVASLQPKSPTQKKPLHILVLGVTGAGKSSIVAAACDETVEIGDGADSCTKFCRPYPIKYRLKEGIDLEIVDTPGFDDPDAQISDLSILKEIVGYASSVCGIIYVHPITETRLTGCSRFNIEVLKAMCGEEFYHRVIICTTMWNNQADQGLRSLEVRQEDLFRQNGPFGDLMYRGAKHMPFWDGREDAGLEILKHFASFSEFYPRMAILSHLSQSKGNLHKTLAGEVVREEHEKRNRKPTDIMPQNNAGSSKSGWGLKNPFGK
ncbi:hypothetical protein LA080_013144 [Diaporthe eres]|nr:hypothetical protein LA080_013144 [Diaporthe eres]